MTETQADAQKRRRLLTRQTRALQVDTRTLGYILSSDSDTTDQTKALLTSVLGEVPAAACLWVYRQGPAARTGSGHKASPTLEEMMEHARQVVPDA